MGWRTVVLLVLVGCSSVPVHTREAWDVPPARWVSDLGRFDERHTYNRQSSVSSGGRWVVFSSQVVDRPVRVFLVNTSRGTVRHLDAAFDGGPRTSPGVRRYTAAGIDPQISSDGRFVVFSSAYSNLVRRDVNDAVDIFLYDRVTRKTRIVSRSSSGEQANMGSVHPGISADGRFVVFDSRATNLDPQDRDFRSDIFRRDIRTGDTELVSVGAEGEADGWSSDPDISGDGNRVSFGSDAPNLVADDTNGLFDIFVRDMEQQETLRASVTSEGEQYQSFESEESASVHHASVRGPTISDNGTVVAFSGNANGLVEDDFNYNDDIRS